MVTASYVLYEKFRDALRVMQDWVAAAGEPVPVMVIYVSMPGSFIVAAVFIGGIVLRAALDQQPVSFANDFPDAIEAHDLVVR